MKRLTILLTISIFVVFSISGCISFMSVSGQPITVSAVFDVIDDPLWDMVKEGMEKAAQEYELDIIIDELDPDDETRSLEKIIKSSVRKRVDAIILVLHNNSDTAETIENVNLRNIPVIHLGSGTDCDSFITSLYTDKYQAAKELFEKMIINMENKGKIAFINTSSDDSDNNLWESGLMKSLEEYPEIELINTFYSEGDEEKAIKITEDIISANSDIGGFIAEDANTLSGIVQVVEEKGLTGDVVVMGFACSHEALNYLDENSIQGLIIQDGFSMGKAGIDVAMRLVQNEEVPETLELGFYFIDSDNISDNQIGYLISRYR